MFIHSQLVKKNDSISETVQEKWLQESTFLLMTVFEFFYFHIQHNCA